MPLTRKQAQEDAPVTLPDGPPSKRRRTKSSSGSSPQLLRNGAANAQSQTAATDAEKLSDSNGQMALKTMSRMKVDSLPILENLSTQILSTLSKTPPQDIPLLLSQPGGHSSANLSLETLREFSDVRSLFNSTKRVYTTRSPFLYPHELGLLEHSHSEILRKANYATFLIGVLTGEASVGELNEHFLEVFVPENGKLLKAQASILLDLKTQAFMASAEQGHADALEHIFPHDLEEQLRQFMFRKRPGAKGLLPSEQDFVTRSRSRREILAEVMKKGGVSELRNRYRREDFNRDTCLYFTKTIDTMCPPPDRDNHQAGRLVSASASRPPQQSEMERMITFPPQPAALPAPTPKAPSPKPQATLPPPPEDFASKAAWAAKFALGGNMPNPNYSPVYQSPPPSLPTPPPQYAAQPPQSQPSFQHYQPTPSPKPNSQRQATSASTSTTVPHASQTAPTQVLYELARRAAVATAKPPKPTKSPSPSQRRPWTQAEESALMAGLDQVQGPHWAQILAAYGPGGTISEALKDRNQVQLKDKARNLKLFFLKNGIEVPYYLQAVTGDLRTRAPAQASKLEGRERERLAGLENRAHFAGVQGMMALSAGAAGTAYGNGEVRADAVPDVPTPPLPELAPEEGALGELDTGLDDAEIDPDL